jgi:carbon storage regulator
MLVLSRKLGEEIVIGGNIRVKVLAVHGNKVRLGFTAPSDVPIHRDELGHKAVTLGNLPALPPTLEAEP